MAEQIKIDPSRFGGPSAQKQGEAASDQTIKGAEARFATAQRKAETTKKAADAQIATATTAAQITEARAKSDKAVADLEKAQIELARLKENAAPLTEGQGKAANFYRRTLSSNLNLDKLALDPDSAIGQLGYQYAPTITHGVSSDKRNAYRSAVENFIAATLRLESGAAVAPDEFTRQYRIYFPQPGAGKEEIEQKRKARELAINGLKAEAGPGARQADLDLAAQGYEIPGINQKETSATNVVGKDRVAGAGAETTAVAPPKEFQKALVEYVNAKGKNLDAQDFQAFFNNLAKKYDYPGRVSAEEAKSNVDAIKGGARYGGAKPPERPLTAVERGVNEALLSTPGAAATGVFNATTMGIPAMLNENVGRSTEGVREEQPLAFGAGDVAGNAAMTALGGAGLKAVGMGAAKADALADLGYSAVTGFTGAPEGEGLSGAATNMVFSGLGSAAPNVVKRVLKPNPDEDIKILREAGVRLTPMQTVGGRADQMEEAASRFLLGGGDVAIAGRKRAYNDFNTAYLNEAGKHINVKLPNGLKPHERMKAMGKAFDDQYDAIKKQMAVVPDQDLLDEIAALRTKIHDGVTYDPTNAARLEKLLDDQLVRRTSNPIGGDEYKSLSSLLKKRRNSFAKSGNQELADGVDEMEGILDSAARRRSPPEVVQALDDTDRGFAMFASAQEAARMAGNKPGEFSAAQILSRQRASDARARSRAFVEGDVAGQRLAEAAQNVLGNVLPSSGTTERLTAGALATGGGSYLSPWTMAANGAIGAINLPGVRDVLPKIFAGQRPKPISALGDLMENYQSGLQHVGSAIGQQFSPSDQTPEDYAYSRLQAASPTAGAQAPAGEDMRVSALPTPEEAPTAAAQSPMIDKATGRPVAFDAATGRLIYLDTGEDAEVMPQAKARGGLMELARKYR